MKNDLLDNLRFVDELHHCSIEYALFTIKPDQGDALGHRRAWRGTGEAAGTQKNLNLNRLRKFLPNSSKIQVNFSEISDKSGNLCREWVIFAEIIRPLPKVLGPGDFDLRQKFNANLEIRSTLKWVRCLSSSDKK